MKKITHRIVTCVLAFVLFFGNAGIGFYLGWPMFVIFLSAIPLVLFPLFQFIKLPMKCDQSGCNGTASICLSTQEFKRWYSLYLTRGHVCETCGHLIKLPRNTKHHDF